MKDKAIHFTEIRRLRKRRQIIVKVVLLSLFFVLITSGVIWFFVFSPVFRFDKIEVVIDDDILRDKITTQLEAQVENSFLKKIFGNRNFLIWPSQLSEKELAALPEIYSLEIDKKYLKNTLTITATERTALGIWCLQKSSPPTCFKFNDSGFIFRKSLATSGNLIKITLDFEQENLKIGDSVLPEEFRENFISVLKVLEDSGLSTKEIILEDLKLQEVKVPLSVGPTLYFSLRLKADIYGEVLKALSQEPKFQDYTYIDLRTENRVYYK